MEYGWCREGIPWLVRCLQRNDYNATWLKNNNTLSLFRTIWIHMVIITSLHCTHIIIWHAWLRCWRCKLHCFYSLWDNVGRYILSIDTVFLWLHVVIVLHIIQMLQTMFTYFLMHSTPNTTIITDIRSAKTIIKAMTRTEKWINSSMIYT